MAHPPFAIFKLDIVRFTPRRCPPAVQAIPITPSLVTHAFYDLAMPVHWQFFTHQFQARSVEVGFFELIRFEVPEVRYHNYSFSHKPLSFPSTFNFATATPKINLFVLWQARGSGRIQIHRVRA